MITVKYLEMILIIFARLLSVYCQKLRMHSFIIFKNGYFVITFFCNINTKSSYTMKSTSTTTKNSHTHTRSQRSNSKICKPKLKLGVVIMCLSFCFFFVSRQKRYIWHMNNIDYVTVRICSKWTIPKSYHGLFGMKFTPIT